MAGRLPSDDVPPSVLRELEDAFSGGSVDPEPQPSAADEAPSADEPDDASVVDVASLDFDDPRLDALLGIAPTPSATTPDAPPVHAGGIEQADAGHLTIDDAVRELADSEPPAGDTTVEAASPATPPVRVIRIGGDDDLPDAEYLTADDDERLRDVHGGPGRPMVSDNSGPRDTIVIGDNDAMEIDAVDVSSVKTPRTMDPRVKARRVAVGRAQGRRRLLIVAVVVGVVAVLVAAFGIVASSMFAVDRVVVQGAVYTDAGRLQAVVDDLSGEPILLADTRAAERRLEEIPWVERARVTTDFPDTVLIDIRERSPLITYVGSDGKWRVADRDGRILDVLDGQPVAPMTINGVGPDAQPGAFAGDAYADVAQLVISLPAEIRSVTTAATVDPATADLGLELDGGTVVTLGNIDDLGAKLARLLNEIRIGFSDLATIDISTGEVSTTPKP